MNNEKIEVIEAINCIKDPKVLVIGDFAIDEMVYGKTARISREAPVLILRHSDTKIILGAASNAAHNISALNNGKVGVIGVCETEDITRVWDSESEAILKIVAEGIANTIE